MQMNPWLALTCCILRMTCVLGLLVGSVVSADDALARARALPPGQREQALRELAQAQVRQRQPVSALRTLAYIQDPRELAEGLSDLRLTSGGGSQQAQSPVVPVAPGDSQTGAAGGAAFADFTSLMDLIQTTVQPDTWEALGGPSTMSPYAAGIVVDANGLVTDIEPVKTGTLVDDLDVLLNVPRAPDDQAQDDPNAWRFPSQARCVSLLGLSKEVLRRRVSGKPVTDDLRALAGLSRIRYVILDEQRQDVILVGPVGGIESRQGWLCDRVTGEVAMRLEYLAAAAASIYSGATFGCTIDPTQESLAAAAKVADKVRSGEIPVGIAADQLRQAIGHQDVKIFGVAGDTPLGYMMVEADRHMKQLALGMQPLPEGAVNYLQMVTKHLDKGAPDGQLLRLWFAPAPVAVRADEGSGVYELAGRPLGLVSETALAAENGGRAVLPDDVRLADFVSDFNQHFDEIAVKHPVYGALRSAYLAATVAELVRRSKAANWLPKILGPMLLDDPSQGLLPTPRQVPSIATMHRAVHRGKRYSIFVASGGVLINPRETLAEEVRPYPTLASLRKQVVVPAEAWWWNAAD